jgi:hypothetical protein
MKQTNSGGITKKKGAMLAWMSESDEMWEARK